MKFRPEVNVFVAVLWVTGFILAWLQWGLVAAVIVMTAGPLAVAGLFSTGKSR